MKITLNSLQTLHRNNEKITVLTCYDASFAKLLENAGIEILLVGDSLGTVLQGQSTTLTVTLKDMIYHTRCVAQGSDNAFIMADMPFATAQVSPEHAFKSAAQLMSAGAHMVKIEGGRIMADTIQHLVQRSIPVCAHVGLTPQSVHQLSGYKVQGKTKKEAQVIQEDALILEKAGASLIVLEAIPATFAKEITNILSIPTIGIGAGPDCSAQVLVLHDMLGVYTDKKIKFVKNFMATSSNVQDAISNYVEEVKTGVFPAKEHCF